MSNEIDVFVETGENSEIPVSFETGHVDVDLELEKQIDYNSVKNKPRINGVELVGDKTTEDLGIEIPDISHLATKSDITSLEDTLNNKIVTETNRATEKENEIESKLNTKQDVISDLSDMRTRLNNLNLQYKESFIPETVLDLSTITISKESASYGFVYNSVRRSLYPQNVGIDSSYAYGKIEFNVEKDTTIEVSYNQSSEETYDYGILSELDETLSFSTNLDENAKWSGEGVSSTSGTLIYTVPAGKHFITFKYIKDSSGDSGDDCFEITNIKINGYAIKKIIDYDTKEEIDLSTDLSNYYTKTEVNDNFVTTNTEQTINNKKIFSFTESVVWGGQESILKILSTHTNNELTEPMWSGRITVGNKNKTFLMGVYHQEDSDTPMCGLGAHRWSNSFNDSGAAWEDVYIQPDGNTSVYIGGYNWTANSGWFRVKNSGAGSSSYKIAINTGTATSPVWRNVLPNQSTGTNSVLIKNSVASSFNYSYSTSINGTVTSNYGASFGYGSSAGNYGVALGSSAIASASYAIQLGKGTNSTANTFSVGLSSSLNVQLLNSAGKIPIDRIDLTQITGYDSSVAQTLKHTADGEIQWVND